MRYLVYAEPDEHSPDGCRVIRISEEEAISKTKEMALKKHNYTYTDDREALADFIAVHWASYDEQDVSQGLVEAE